MPTYHLVQGYHATGDDAALGLGAWQQSGNVHASLDGISVERVSAHVCPYSVCITGWPSLL